MTALHAAGGGLPLALHIPHVVEQAGSIAGFASVIGLAILSALYFSQARDLRRLREWAGRAPERAAEGQPGAVVPGRVVAVPQQRPAAAQAGPAPATAAAATPAAAAAASNGEKSEEAEKQEQPAAAATNGDAAPAVTAPGAEKDSEGQGDEAKGITTAAKPGMPAPASAAAAAAGAGAKSVAGPAAPGSAPAASPGSDQPGSPGSEGPGKASTGADTPGSGQGASTGAGVPAGSAPAVAGATTAAGSTAATASAPGATASAPGATKSAPQQAGGPRPAPSPQRPPGSVLPPRTGTLPPVRRLPSSNVVGPAQTGALGSAEPAKKKRNPVYVVLAVAGVLVLGAAAAVGVPALVNGSKDDKNSSTTATKTTTAAKKKATPAVSADKITVAVLNGTSIPGLAAQVGDRVDAEGFTLGTVSNASQTQSNRANSVALYATGHQSDARRVARRLNIRNIGRLDPDTQQIAGDATVVVIVGSDKTQ
jgi:hypothetical protein